ncbi:hypothetical protein [Ewingella americana]|uniref:Uncharacterized protein n=1 Tax=Ewingella americana TaxID=41202 RepID=A0A502GHE2_9GAMM|nr:hypothetical protein [Ewingella americana]TPG60143.1 hypothetical protein EAH77_16370 [Ewingella americana]
MSIIKSIKTKSKNGSAIRATLDNENNIRVFLAGDGCEGTHTLTEDDKKSLMAQFAKAPVLEPRKVAQNASYRAGYGGGRA